MYVQNNYPQMEQEIAAFINYPTEANTEKIYDYLNKLCAIKYQSQITYSSSKYCKLSGEEITEDPIIIEGHCFSLHQIHQYYIRHGILDVSIGDLKFNYSDGITENFVTIELTQEILQKIYGANLDQMLQEAHHHFDKRLKQPVLFTCEQTGRSGVISEQMIVNGKQVCTEWAHQNKDQLSEEQRIQLESSQRIQYNLGNSQNIH
ncbi:unnamed protein product (macronuclear) [Paramecium tetraurelia]|uniref:Uncharacterized protein n=1 Tax=Paramecium tetraurelia TaxID=5888 RepID=A0C0N6_PARTE|nr:uncharacterized protein GSPATT00006206001 [Paramecium tetraurelia]CAK64353.1 unnamed protein product [Paramecium tetraurelia]|eukprot:XP_001431751.1 hypothetical protein (macronuclear) [Paramecium tetraurelia strain d4-2]